MVIIILLYHSSTMYSALRSVFARACGEVGLKKLKQIMPEYCDACLNPELEANQMAHNICMGLTFAEQIQTFLPEVSPHELNPMNPHEHSARRRGRSTRSRGTATIRRSGSGSSASSTSWSSSTTSSPKSSTAASCRHRSPWRSTRQPIPMKPNFPVSKTTTNPRYS